MGDGILCDVGATDYQRADIALILAFATIGTLDRLFGLGNIGRWRDGFHYVGLSPCAGLVGRAIRLHGDGLGGAAGLVVLG